MKALIFTFMISVLMPSVAIAGNQAKEETRRLASDWIQALIDVNPDGSIKVLRMLDRGPLPALKLEPYLEQVTFPPHRMNGEAVTYRTGMFIRAFIVQAEGSRHLEFGKAFLAPLVDYYPSRPWPEGAWEDGLGGEVIFDASVDDDGEVVAAERIGGDAPDSFNEAARAVVMKTRFVPPEANGDEVASKVIIDLYYEPEERKSARRSTPAIVKLPKSKADEEDPHYLGDLPSWVDYEVADSVLLNSVMGWEFDEEADANEGVQASIVNRRLVIPSEARFLLLPDVTEESREAVIH